MEATNRVTGLVGILERRSGLLVLLAIVLTGLLTLPMVFLASDEEASQDPADQVYDLQADINDRFQSPTHGTFYVIEARDGNVLTQPVLAEIHRNSQAVRDADVAGELAPEGLPAQSYLYTIFDGDTGRETVGFLGNIADAVQRVLVGDPRLNTTLEEATEDQVKLAVHGLLANPETAGLSETLAQQTTSQPCTVAGQEIQCWTTPALFFNVLADNERLGGGTLTIGVAGGDTVMDKEQFARKVQELLRGDQITYRLWGIAIDANLESADEGQIAGAFIMFTVIAAVLIVGVSLRSYWAMALTGAGLGILMVWLKGISALIGIKSGLVIDLIVPIAMISLGVDFAVHAVRRYQEERGLGYAPRRALQVGFAGVLGALALAMASDGIAFLANASSGIEAVVHFGIAAAVAVIASFLVLGIIVPLALLRIDEWRQSSATSGSIVVRVLTVLAAIGASALFGTAVILMVAVSAPLGVAMLALATVAFIGAPAAILWWRARGRDGYVDQGAAEVQHRHLNGETGIISRVVGGVARFAPVVLIGTTIMTGVAIWLAVQLEPTFDVKDFFDNGSSFVIGLDKVDEYVGDRGGEPGIIYLKGDLTDPEALIAIDAFMQRLQGVPKLAYRETGELFVEDNFLSLLRDVTGSAFVLGLVQEASGLAITDDNGDGFPDTREQLVAVYEFLYVNGLPLDAERLRYDSGQIRQLLYYDGAGREEDVAIIVVGIVGSREQANVTTAGDSLRAELATLEAHSAITTAALTGSPFTREKQLIASTQTLQTSMPIAAAGAFILLLVVFRSVRYAAVTIVPVGLVVAWLYGFMYLTGFALNFVTATIGAVSIGVGIDYSIHMTERFREELRRAPDRMQALCQAASGTGVALVASAASSIVGFAIMGLAPMPMFSAYGQLTAIMIFLALAASLLVLPSLLLIVTREGAASVETQDA